MSGLDFMGAVRNIVALIRPWQWPKNLFVAAPVFFYGHWSPDLVVSTLYAVLIFSLASSASYCLNDIMDADLDRSHADKSKRPVASGAVSPSLAALVALGLGAAALAAGFAVTRELGWVICVYLVFQISYSCGLKHIVIVDLLLLACSYILRILAGVGATGIVPSNWLLIVTALTALMLAVGKRYLEILRYRPGTAERVTRPVLEQYPALFLRQIMSGIAAAVLVSYLLWCSEAVALGRFRAIEIFPSALFVTYGVLRYLLLVYRRAFDEDPTRGLVRDKPIVASFLCFLLWIAAIIR